MYPATMKRTKRAWLAALPVALLAISCQQTVRAQEAAEPGFTFNLELVWRANVTIGETLELGQSKYGIRRIVPITGGTFEGPDISGTRARWWR